MRADRLLTTLLLLQHRREMSAPELAAELGVSVRTVYRDMEALSEIGIPLYADRGAQGGFRLVEEYRSGLNGLTRDERNALSLLDLPEPLADLTIGRQLRNALLKLVAAGSAGPPHILLDWSAPARPGPVPDVQRLVEAMEQGRQVRLRYRLWGDLEVALDARPYGLVLSGGAWWLVAEIGGRVRAIPAADWIGLHVLNVPFTRPAPFDLKASWAALQAEAHLPRPGYAVVLRVAEHLPDSALCAQGTLLEDGSKDDYGWRCVTLRFDHAHDALRAVLGWGGAVEVVAPEALRLTVQDYAAQILRRYGHVTPEIGHP